MSEALTKAPQLPVEGDQQILVQHVPVDAHVIHELGHISAMPGEDHLGGGHDPRCQSQSATRQRLALIPTLVH